LVLLVSFVLVYCRVTRDSLQHDSIPFVVLPICRLFLSVYWIKNSQV
jgi:hypothetical protein